MITPSFGITATERVLPKLALDFTTASLDARVTFARTTGASNPATYVNSSGVITSATNNQPRFDYDPITLACKGLLIEESRTNLWTHSEDFSDAAWLKTNATITSNATTAPDGTATSDKIIRSNGATTAENLVRSSATGFSNINYSASIFAKKAEWSFLRIFARNKNDTAVASHIDLDSGTVVLNNHDVKVESLNDGWYRIKSLHRSSTGTLNVYYSPIISNVSFGTGNGVDGIYGWGAQIEAGDFATSYIPTTTAALTRNADVATMTGTNFSSWYNQPQGTFFTQYQLEGWATTQSRCGLGVSDGTTASRMRHLVTSLTQSGFIGDGSGTTATLLQTVPNVTQNINKSAAGYKLNSVAACANAGNVGTNSSFTPPTVDRAYIGSIETNGASAFLNGWLQKINYYPQRLTNAEIQAITK